MLLRIQDIRKLIHTISLEEFFKTLAEKLQEDFSHWQDFQKSARLDGQHSTGGFASRIETRWSK